MSEYHKIETLYERDVDTFKVNPGVLKNRVYGAIKTWWWTEKVDGTNIRIMWDGSKINVGGKTDNAQIHADLVRYLYGLANPDNMRSVFGETSAVLYGEGYGAGIQKGGAYSPLKQFILFDVLADSKWWLAQENVDDVGSKLGIQVVPKFGEMTLEQATELVAAGFASKIGGMAEGLVGRTVEPLFDKKGARLIVKLKTKDF